MATAVSRQKALVVEDEVLIRMSLCDMLEEIGLETVEAGSGLDGLAFLSHDPSIGVLVVDLGLPDVSGEELVRRARNLRPMLKVIVSTGHSTAQHQTRPEFAGVAFLSKPFDISGLRRAIETA